MKDLSLLSVPLLFLFFFFANAGAPDCPPVYPAPYRPPIWEGATSFKLKASATNFNGYNVDWYVVQDSFLKRQVQYVVSTVPGLLLSPFLCLWIDELTQWSVDINDGCSCVKADIPPLSEIPIALYNFWNEYLEGSVYNGTCQGLNGACGQLYDLELASGLHIYTCLELHTNFNRYPKSRTPNPLLPSDAFVPPTPLYISVPAPPGFSFSGIRLDVTYFDYMAQPWSYFKPPSDCFPTLSGGAAGRNVKPEKQTRKESSRTKKYQPHQPDVLSSTPFMVQKIQEIYSKFITDNATAQGRGNTAPNNPCPQITIPELSWDHENENTSLDPNYSTPSPAPQES